MKQFINPSFVVECILGAEFEQFIIRDVRGNVLHIEKNRDDLGDALDCIITNIKCSSKIVNNE